MKLVALEGLAPGTEYTLEQRTITLGRTASCDVVLDDDDVSREHCRISPRDDGYVIEDLDSSNGTIVNGQLIQSPAYLRPGDLVVVVPEYEQYDSILNGERGLADLVTVAPENLRYFSSPRQYLVLLENMPISLQDKTYAWLVTATHGAPPTSDIYRRDGFNQYGDITTHLGRPPQTEWQKKFDPGAFKPKISGEALGVLNEFQDYADAKGAQVVLLFPCVPDIIKPEGRQSINDIYRRLKADTRMNIPSQPENYVYPLGCFFDSQYHLTDQCREKRTQQILDDLTRAGLAGDTAADR
jgi:hypothetical protein